MGIYGHTGFSQHELSLTKTFKRFDDLALQSLQVLQRHIQEIAAATSWVQNR